MVGKDLGVVCYVCDTPVYNYSTDFKRQNSKSYGLKCKKCSSDKFRILKRTKLG